jgi:hypothetical protein
MEGVLTAQQVRLYHLIHNASLVEPKSTADSEDSKSRHVSEMPIEEGEEGEAMDDVNDDDAAMMAMMGMSGFGSTKVCYVHLARTLLFIPWSRANM